MSANNCNICESEIEDLFGCGSCGVLFCKECGNSIRLLCNHCSEFADSSRLESFDED